MRLRVPHCLLSLLLICGMAASGQNGTQRLSELLSAPGIDLSRAADRARVVQQMKTVEDERLAQARAKAQSLGLPLRRTNENGQHQELWGFAGDRPIYLTTNNVNAAISTAANLVRTSPYTLDGNGVTVGVWDAGSGRTTHQEFATGSRMTNMDGSSTHSHAMHVSGTIAAAGVSANARGMANAALIDNYDWTSDISEMTSRAATAAGQATMVYLSNHSYSYGYGWDGNTWIGDGLDQNAVDQMFGQYGGVSSNIDAVAYNAPYYLSFWAAGNERNDNPATGATVIINGSSVSYDPAIHPPGDSLYLNGFGTVGHHASAKNNVAIGAVNDAVTSGSRDLAKATLANFSSTGPTDDGRIKPDLVANGVGLYSSIDTSDTAYGNSSGTSMASPSACGSAALLVEHYGNLFSGGAMRSSTLKGLLIHTADDIGNPGPDYKFGWGLIDTKEAADLLIDHQAHPLRQRLTEARLTTATPSKTIAFNWDGVSPIRATICWTDPTPGSTSVHDLRTPALVNDLNLKVIAPNGTEYFPFVMPYVGDWTTSTLDSQATTGINTTDNVEQVLIDSPAQSGTWQVVLSHAGSLTNGEQEYGLLLDGAAEPNELWIDNLDSGASGWSQSSSSGSNTWSLATADPQSGDTSWFAAGPASITTTHLVSPPIPVPADGSDLQLSFWHQFDLQPGIDGGRLELSIDDGASWTAVDDPSSGASFARNGHNTTLNETGNPNQFSDLEGLTAWSGNSGGYILTIVNLGAGTYAGQTLRARWTLGTNGSTASNGWHIDTVWLTGTSAIEFIPPTLASSDIVDDQGGGPVGYGNPITFTVTFNEDMDATTVTSADFSNAGTSAITFGTITETSAGVFTVEVTPTSVGTLQLQVNAGAVIEDTSGNPLDTTAAITDDTTLTILTPFTSWSGGDNPGSDADGGGVSTGMEWVLGGDPADHGDDPDITPTSDDSNPDFFIYTYRRADAAFADSDTSIAVEYCSSLGNWTTAVHDGTTVIITVSDDAAASGVDLVEVKISRDLATSSRIFARLRVEITSP